METKRTLLDIGSDLEKLSELLDECGDDIEQQELINQWLETVGAERDRKLDNYAALISELQARADVRKAEAKRLLELAATDENRARLLKDRLKWFFQSHNLKTIHTTRYRISLAGNGGKHPLKWLRNVLPNELPPRFQQTTVEVNNGAIREALEAGEQLDFAQLGDRGHSIRIK